MTTLDTSKWNVAHTPSLHVDTQEVFTVPTDSKEHALYVSRLLSEYDQFLFRCTAEPGSYNVDCASKLWDGETGEELPRISVG